MDENCGSCIYPGLKVRIKTKKIGEKNLEGEVQEVLTSATFHSKGIKVRLTNGLVGRVSKILHLERKQLSVF